MPDTLRTPTRADLLAQAAAAREAPAQVALADLLALGEQIEEALATARADAERAKTAALDPGIDFEAAQERRAQAERMEHEVLRLAFALNEIADLLPDRTSAHDAAEREARYAAALAASDEVTAEIAYNYPRWVADLTGLLERLIRTNDQVDAANADLPPNRAPIGRPDGRARGFLDHAADGAPIDYLIVRLTQMVLPHPTKMDQLAWPPGYVHHNDQDRLWPNPNIVAAFKKRKNG